jgi:hypothetical protein
VRLALSGRQVRVALGVLWLFDAGLQAQPAHFTASWWRVDLAQSAMGEPRVVHDSILWAVGIIAGNAAVFNAGFVLLQAALGSALVSGRLERCAIALSVPWALGVWWVGEGFGELPTGFGLAAAGAPGPVLLYPLVGLLAWPRRGEPTHGHGSRPPTPHSVRNDSVRNDTGGSATVPAPAIAGIGAWVALWTGQALLLVPWSFPTRRVLLANLEESSLGQPAWLQALARTTADVVDRHAVAVAVGMVALQALVGLGVAVPRARRTSLLSGVAASLVFWVLFQGLGGLGSSGATDPGSAPLMILLAVSLWPSRSLWPSSSCEAGARSARRTMPWPPRPARSLLPRRPRPSP